MSRAGGLCRPGRGDRARARQEPIQAREQAGAGGAAEDGFPFWMYKHGGSADPRPQHLAWDGMVLPADHPFWNTHSPPNGWGCSCRIVGVRDKEMARRLGGKPDKALPEGWDEVSAKTGEPAGIDRGWGYQPGATVADAVQQMAAKTQQWDYTLAKAYMENVPEPQRDALARAYRGLPSVADDTRRYAQRILEGPAGTVVPPYRTLGLLTRAQATEVAEKIGRKVDGFDFAVGRDAPIHIRATHGDSGAEGLRGQRAVMPKDYARLPLIVDDPDAIQPAGLSGVGHPIVRFIRVIDGEKFIAALEVRGGRKTLALQSLWIGKP
ncbi:MAG: hypothetical protein DYH17_15540 [Xanthomonadales bacterium PRO6]|nr:hypothetical protein [Xanthomonadales bacterium PRO6]